jgi:hypothetical protein
VFSEEAWITFLKATASVEIGVNNIGAAIDIALKSVKMKPNIDVTKFNVQISMNDIDIRISGGFIQKMIEFVANILKDFVGDELIKMLASMVPGQVDEQVNNALRNQVVIDCYCSHSFKAD